MEENNYIKEESKKALAPWKVFFIFAAAIVLICGIIFLFDYNNAYKTSTDGGWIPPSFGVIYYYFLVSVVSIIVSIILKIILKKRVKIWSLIATAVLFPIFCYNFNILTYSKAGLLYPLVDKGGIFHFIVNHDFNFDGMNDEQHHLLYDERKYSTREGGHFDDTIIDYIDSTAIGTGPALSVFTSYDWENKIIDLHINNDNVIYKKVTITIAFIDPEMAKSSVFYFDKIIEPIQNVTINEDNTVTLMFDAETCADWQFKSGMDLIEIPIKYHVYD